MDSWLSSEKIWQHLELSQHLCTGSRNLMWSEISRTWECILLHISIQSLSNSNGCLSTWCPRPMVFQSVIEKKKKMDEVSVGAAASTSVVDLSGDSHLQVEAQDLTKLLATIKRLRFHIPKGWYIGCPVREGQSEIHSSHKNRSPFFKILFKECKAIPWHSISAISVLHQQCNLPRYARVCQVRVLRDPVTWGEDNEENQKTRMRKVSFLKGGEKHPICIACAQDFIWLHDVIQENLQYAGFIIPPKVRMAFIPNDSFIHWD